jgi:hypothetical protein
LAEYEWVEEMEDEETGEVWTRRDREWLVLAEMIGAKMRKSVVPAFMSSYPRRKCQRWRHPLHVLDSPQRTRPEP